MASSFDVKFDPAAMTKVAGGIAAVWFIYHCAIAPIYRRFQRSLPKVGRDGAQASVPEREGAELDATKAALAARADAGNPAHETPVRSRAGFLSQPSESTVL